MSELISQIKRLSLQPVASEDKKGDTLAEMKVAYVGNGNERLLISNGGLTKFAKNTLSTGIDRVGLQN